MRQGLHLNRTAVKLWRHGLIILRGYTPKQSDAFTLPKLFIFVGTDISSRNPLKKQFLKIPYSIFSTYVLYYVHALCSSKRNFIG